MRPASHAELAVAHRAEDLAAGIVRPRREADEVHLGALEGGLSFEMAREGWDATGVEGRADNFRKASLIASYYALPNLRFVHKDVKELSPERDGTFDVILCCGLLYHLDEPVAHLRQLESLLAPQGLLFLDTHVAPDEHAVRYATHEASLSGPVTFRDGEHEYDGRWWSEPSAGDLKERMWSAISNARSIILDSSAFTRSATRASASSEGFSISFFFTACRKVN